MSPLRFAAHSDCPCKLQTAEREILQCSESIGGATPNIFLMSQRNKWGLSVLSAQSNLLCPEFPPNGWQAVAAALAATVR